MAGLMPHAAGAKESMRFIDIFKTRDGAVVIGQKPNLPLIVWFVAFILRRVFPDGALGIGIYVIGFLALFIWAWLELFMGVNIFRRILGFVVLVLSVISVASR